MNVWGHSLQNWLAITRFQLVSQLQMHYNNIIIYIYFTSLNSNGY